MTDRHLDEEQAIVLAMGQAPEPEEGAHLAACEDCRERVASFRKVADEGHASLRPLEEVAPLSPAASLRVLEAVRAQTRPARWPSLALVGGVLVAAGALAGRELGGHDPSSLALPLLTLGTAVVVAALASTRSAGAAALVSVAVSLTLGALDAHDAGGFHVTMGIRCMGIELVLGGLAAIVLHVGGVAQKRPEVLAAAAGAGALAGQAGLMIACHAPGTLLHGLAFHTLGVVIAVAAASSTRWLRTTA